MLMEDTRLMSLNRSYESIKNKTTNTLMDSLEKHLKEDFKYTVISEHRKTDV